MSKKLVSLNRDILRLEEQGYLLETREGHLVVHGVPYLTPDGRVAHGAIVAVVDPGSRGGVKQPEHQIWFKGEQPSNLDGTPIRHMSRSDNGSQLDQGLSVDHRFSMKLKAGNTNRDYEDDFEKITTYFKVISAPAYEQDPVKASEPPALDQTPLPPSPFVYPDMASARAGITMIGRKLGNQKIAIVGLGGTGGYVLDQVAKTRVAEIHLFDGDEFKTHNAYRAPGAATEAQAQAGHKKVCYFGGVYGAIHANITPHDYDLGSANASELDGMDFVFLCMDTGPAKESLVNRLEAQGVPFVDTGLSLRIVEGTITGILRATTSSHQVGDIGSRQRLSFRPPDEADAYRQNIQVGDLNALNALMAVIRWKKLFGFYADDKSEHHSTYTIALNGLTSLDRYDPDKPPGA
jgi:hypothetical protein